MDFEPSQITVDKLVALVESSQIALPDFQRDFIWGPSKVVELLESVANGWPTGSLLLLEGPQDLKARAIDDAPSLRGPAKSLILDGQQRITALFHAVADASDTVYYVDFARLAAEDGDYIKWERRRLHDRQYKTVAERAAAGIAKISEVFDGQRFYDWLSNAPPELAAKAQKQRESYLPGLRSRVYKMPVVSLDRDIPLSALARIFETINRTGVRLNAFDLMVAVLSPHDFSLRDSWEEAKTDHDRLTNFEIDGIEILKLIGLWERRRQKDEKSPITVRGIRQSDVLAIPASAIKKNWKRAVLYYDKALMTLVERYGIPVGSDAIPSHAMTLTLAYLLERKRTTCQHYTPVRGGSQGSDFRRT